MKSRSFLILLALGLFPAGFAQKFADVPHGESAAAVPILKRVGIDQKLGAQVPPDLYFRDESGKRVRLGDYFGTKPVVLSLAYYRCPMLCTLALNGQLRVYRVLGFDLGKQFNAVTVSIDPRETPALAYVKRQSYLQKYGRPGADGWHFLTGDEASIRALADAVGFHYYYDKTHDQYAHATGLMVLTPQGKISAYQYGVEYSARDLRLSLIRAAGNRIGTPVDQLLLYCFHYNPATGAYSLVILRVLRLLGVVTLVLLFGFVALMLRRDRKRKSRFHEVKT